MSCLMMMSLGVYVLGAADGAERARVEAHLPGCPACQAELIKLTPLPGLLAGVPGDMRAQPAPPGRTARRPAHAGARIRPARRRRAITAAACVAAACVAAGTAGGIWLTATGAARRPATLTLSGTNPATHVSATAVLTATSWGSSIRLRLSGAPLNVPCRLIARSRTGATEVTGVWDAWSDGPITVPASAGWRPSDIASLQVATTAKTLVTIDGEPNTASH
jgi:predicted anti-sigma-YlaC factor YlaD